MRTARNHKFFLVLMVFTLVVVNCFTLGPTAHAASSISKDAKAYVSVNTSLNLRDSPGGNVIGEIYNGDSVTILSDYSFSGYYYVRVDRTGQKCYVHGQYLTPKDHYTNNWNNSEETDCGYDGENTPISQLKNTDLENTTLIVISSNGASMRQSSTDGSVWIKHLKYGSTLKVLIPSITNNYILVQDSSDGTIGYVSANSVALYGKNNNSNTSEPTSTLVLVSELENVDLTNATLTVVSNLPLNLRETASIRGKWIKYLSDGDSVKVVSPNITNNYILVQDTSDNKVGYVDIRYVGMYVKNATSNTPPSYDYDSNHDCCNSTTTNNQIPIGQLNNPNLENATLVVLSSRQLNMRQSASKDGKWIKYLKNGDKLQVISPTITNDYILVRDISDNTLGYVHVDYVAFSNTWYNSTTCDCCYDCNCMAR